MLNLLKTRETAGSRLRTMAMMIGVTTLTTAALDVTSVSNETSAATSIVLSQTGDNTLSRSPRNDDRPDT